MVLSFQHCPPSLCLSLPLSLYVCVFWLQIAIESFYHSDYDYMCYTGDGPNMYYNMELLQN